MSSLSQLTRFGCTGAAASAVHLCVVAALVPFELTPLAANVAGFAIAFHVSYHGHRSWTFRRPGGPREYKRMLAVSLLAFALNELLYAGLLKWTRLDYRVALGLVLLTVAAGTFAATRVWVFTREHRAAHQGNR
ncbi:GtrA family protein [Luteolibacter arcticus]|uniref:GtrA family protein n=1 Tax=Luteolibacter arcticus TaxID=1581411 RepID=A0ABT3GG24_9BACT|nr:GtrA family protein [Luteolibacter arcticus]MCW1922572.1 GtrA family protein [Luteolibacter arcticus]